MVGHFCLFYVVLLSLTSLVAGDKLQNVALNKKAEQSSGSGAEKAVDGKKPHRSDQTSCSRTNPGNDSWWRVDLEEQTKVLAVIISSSQSFSLDGVEIWIDTSLNSSTSTSTRCGMIPSFSKYESLYLSCNGVRGRILTLLLPGRNRVLSLCEVQVFPTDFVYPQANVALKGKAVQSSTLFPAQASRAIDGKRHTYYTEGSCSHTGSETAPWWRVDLHQTFIISQVKVTNRGDCCPQRLDGAQIRIGNSLDNNGNDNPWCTNVTHIPGGHTFTFSCESGSLEGRYVNVFLPGDKKILTLCEVEVYADPAVEPLRQVALGKTATQSSVLNKYFYINNQYSGDYFSGGAYKAVGQCLGHVFNRACCIQTYAFTQNWWRVDLGSEHRVSAVVIFNRKDCCSNNIKRAKIKIGNEQPSVNNPTCAIIPSSALIQTFYCAEMEGRYVSVHSPRDTALTFCRVEVYATPVEPEPVAPPLTPPPSVTFPSESAQVGGRTVLLVGGLLCWADALFYCRRYHWDLLSLHSPEEQALVEELLHNSTFRSSENVWLGLRREVMGLRWFWMSGDALSFENWRQYVPLFPHACGGMEAESALWRPVSCGDLNHFLCQTAPPQTTNRVYYYSSKVKT